MVESTKTVAVEMSCSELFQMVNGLIFIARKYTETGAPEVLINQTLYRAKKFNAVLMSAGYDHFTDDMFDQLIYKHMNKGAKDE